MANRMKEDERNEKTIRGLSKLPPNRRCINCNNLGPQYVCTNFWTFICTNCSGIHREFTHRVKSISMAKFTSQEVIALQEGGNERAKEIYFKEWDPQRHSFPDSNNIDKLRDFMKHVYLDRRYTGERSTDRPPRVKGDREDYNENKRGDSYQSGSRSPPYDDRYNDQGGFGGRDELRSPGYDLGDNKRSPGRFEGVDERRRDDRYGNQNRRFEDRRFPDGVPKPEGRSPNHQKDIGASSPPMVQPLKDILGNDAPRLLVGDPPKSNGSKIPDNSTQTQRTSSSSSLGSIEGTSVQLKRVNSGSLIDFNTDPEPPVPAQPRQSVPPQTTSSSTDAGNWASFDIGEQKKAPQLVAKPSTLESTLAELVAPGPAPGGNMPTLIGFNAASPQQANFDAGLMMQQQQPSLFPAANNQFTNHQFNSPAVGSLNQGFQSWAPSQPSSLQASLIAPDGHPSQAVQIQQQETRTGVPVQTPSEAKPSERKALPEDFFASLYPSVPTSAPGWQRGPLLGMGYAMQYPTGAVGMTMPTYPHSSKSVNPFDLVNGPASAQAPTFPSMVPLQGALPNMTGPSPLLGTSGFGTSSPRWVPQQQPVYPSAVSQSPYMMQQTPSNMPPQNFNVPTQMLHQGMGAPSFGGVAFGASDAPNYFSPVGGNPFG